MGILTLSKLAERLRSRKVSVTYDDDFEQLLVGDKRSKYCTIELGDGSYILTENEMPTKYRDTDKLVEYVVQLVTNRKAEEKPDKRPTNDHFVWQETTEDTWVKAVDLPLTVEEANALCVILQAMRPKTSFEVSVFKPQVLTLSRRK